ncbi:hypothetical protein ACVC7V_04390 [Hydrogenophaga sp. A37]|uniref:hypothetical protein n=1 Tax=Hydrogenophaga sp. A37 TaxID=1945864 RepID=UPI0009869B96|nr:hypothetical protein [Hydrogenophaga sp. A37]OOG81062.1 hypothetical protein B0E41_19000 [Hydrogenophaga sp. A37]
MKKLVWLAALVVLFYGHSRWMLSESRVLPWIEKHEQAVFEQKEGVCNHFTWDTKVSVRANHAKGEWQLDGDKAYMCDYIRAANATVRLLKPQIHTDTELVSLQRSGFPWMSAEVKVQQTTRFELPGRPTLTETGETTYVLRRTVKGMQIAEMTTRSEGNFPR